MGPNWSAELLLRQFRLEYLFTGNRSSASSLTALALFTAVDDVLPVVSPTLTPGEYPPACRAELSWEIRLKPLSVPFALRHSYSL